MGDIVYMKDFDWIHSDRDPHRIITIEADIGGNILQQLRDAQKRSIENDGAGIELTSKGGLNVAVVYPFNNIGTLYEEWLQKVEILRHHQSKVGGEVMRLIQDHNPGEKITLPKTPQDNKTHLKIVGN